MTDDLDERKEQEEAAAYYQKHKDDEDTWVEAPPSSDVWVQKIHVLHISFYLEGDDWERFTRVAHKTVENRSIGYVALAKSWVLERIKAEEQEESSAWDRPVTRDEILYIVRRAREAVARSGAYREDIGVLMDAFVDAIVYGLQERVK